MSICRELLIVNHYHILLRSHSRRDFAVLKNSSFRFFAMGKWKRPESVEFPVVWRRFEGKNAFPNGKKPRFRIQDVTEELTDGVMYLMMYLFARDEPICGCLDIKNDEASMEELKMLWTECLNAKTTLVCVLENKEELGDDTLPVVAGCNMTVPKEPEDHLEFRADLSKKISDLMEFCETKVDCFKLYDSDVVLTAMGLSVDRKFRGQGIGLELLKTRFDMGKALSIPATVTVFTAIASQKLAEKLEYDVLFEVPYDEYKVDGEVVFKNMKTKTVKYMGRRLT